MAFAPARFIKEVRSEVSKVIWPTRKEVIVSTIMVLIMALIAALFFLAADQVISLVIGLILNFGS